MNHLEEYVKNIHEELGISEKFISDSSGTYVISIDEDTKISVLDNKDLGYYIYADILKLSEGDKETFYVSAMRGNLFGEGTGEAVLGLDAKGETLVLSQLLPSDIDYRNFEYAIEDFCNWIEFWRDESQRMIKQSSGPYF